MAGLERKSVRWLSDINAPRRCHAPFRLPSRGEVDRHDFAEIVLAGREGVKVSTSPHDQTHPHPSRIAHGPHRENRAAPTAPLKGAVEYAPLAPPRLPLVPKARLRHDEGGIGGMEGCYVGNTSCILIAIV
jgi:hypothetical protein